MSAHDAAAAAPGLFVDRGAGFSACRAYRYTLWRSWDRAKPWLAFVMLNPSTADATTDDPTVARCGERARRLGYGGLAVVNLFALRSTDPLELYRHPDPVGPHNDSAILSVASEAGAVVCAWGNHGRLHGRDGKVLELLARLGVQPMALKVSRGGHPGHPLYLPYNLTPQPYTPPARILP